MMLSRLNFLSFENRAKNRASPLLFAIFIALHLVVVFAFVRYFFRPTWDAHVASGPWAILATILVCNVVTCFGEYFFHRYLLHLETVKFLGRLCTSHRAHHKLTYIKFDDKGPVVRSEYPITDVAHDHQATFPPWALIPFFAAFTPFFAAIAFSFPEIPILIGGYTAVAIAHFLYEVLHVAHHQPYETWWKGKIEGRILGGMWRRMYGFHQAHHANYRCNMNIAGFYGIPLADLVLGTYKQPDTLLIDGARVSKETARKLTPQGYRLITWLDHVVFKRRRRMVKES
jgi:hemolysin III